MFGIFNVVDNALDVVGDLFTGEDISREKVSKLIADGVGIAIIAQGFGVAESVIEELMDDDD